MIEALIPIKIATTKLTKYVAKNTDSHNVVIITLIVSSASAFTICELAKDILNSDKDVDFQSNLFSFKTVSKYA